MKINCYFSTDKHTSYRTCLNRGENSRRKMEQKNAYECHHSSTFFTRNPRYDKHVENCPEKPGVVHRFENQNLVTFGDNLK